MAVSVIAIFFIKAEIVDFAKNLNYLFPCKEVACNEPCYLPCYLVYSDYVIIGMAGIFILSFLSIIVISVIYKIKNKKL